MSPWADPGPVSAAERPPRDGSFGVIFMIVAGPPRTCFRWQGMKKAARGQLLYQGMKSAYSPTTSKATSVLLPLPKSITALKEPISLTSSGMLIFLRSIS